LKPRKVIFLKGRNQDTVDGEDATADMEVEAMADMEATVDTVSLRAGILMQHIVILSCLRWTGGGWRRSGYGGGYGGYGGYGGEKVIIPSFSELFLRKFFLLPHNRLQSRRIWRLRRRLESWLWILRLSLLDFDSHL
jgi:hypothetical protein